MEEIKYQTNNKIDKWINKEYKPGLFAFFRVLFCCSVVHEPGTEKLSHLLKLMFRIFTFMSIQLVQDVHKLIAFL